MVFVHPTLKGVALHGKDMGRRKLTPAEIQAYDEMARAAAKLREAQAAAEAERQAAKQGVSLSIDPPTKPESGKGGADE